MAGPDPPGSFRDREVERERLAHELHDIVTHHLANVAVRTMGGWEGTGARELRAILREVHAVAGAALGELRILGRLLPGAGDRSADAVGDLTRPLSPLLAAAAWSRTLESAGVVGVSRIPETVEDLPRSVQATLVRSLEATASAVTRLAARGSRCTVTVEVEPTQVVLRTSTEPPPHGHDAAGDAGHVGGLEGLRHRTELVAGRFATEVHRSSAGTLRWVVTVVLPLDRHR